jgi:hypothetical protein
MGLRDYFLAPAADAVEPPARHRRREQAATTTATSLGVLAAPRDLPAAAAAAGLVIARAAPAALVFLDAPEVDLATPLPAPARVAATRLAASLTARGITAHARGHLVLAHPAPAPAEGGASAPRAIAAAGSLPTVLGVAVRGPGVDDLLARQDALLVALPRGADAALAELALEGARELCRSAAALSLALDPLSRALALGGWRAPRVVREALEGALA